MLNVTVHALAANASSLSTTDLLLAYCNLPGLTVAKLMQALLGLVMVYGFWRSLPALKDEKIDRLITDVLEGIVLGLAFMIPIITLYLMRFQYSHNWHVTLSILGAGFFLMVSSFVLRWLLGER